MLRIPVAINPIRKGQIWDSYNKRLVRIIRRASADWVQWQTCNSAGTGNPPPAVTFSTESAWWLLRVDGWTLRKRGA